MTEKNNSKTPERLEAELIASQFELDQARKARERLVRIWWIIGIVLGIVVIIGLWQMLLIGS